MEVDLVIVASSVTAILLSIASISFQFYQWKYSGARLRIHLHFAYLTYKHSTPMLQIEISNIGRSPMQINNIWIKPFTTDNSIVILEYEPGSNSLPTMVGAGENRIWFTELGQILEILHKENEKYYFVKAGLPGGQIISSKRQMVNGKKMIN